MLKLLCKIGLHKYGPILIHNFIPLQQCKRCQHIHRVEYIVQNSTPKFKLGDYIHNGYSRMKIIGMSDKKDCTYVVAMDPLQSDCRGAWKMYGYHAHISDEALLECRKVD